jgi:hypothetical protein
MTIPQAIELLLNRMNTRQQFVGGTFAGWGGGTTGNITMQQRDVNAAIAQWQAERDPIGLKQVASTLHLYGNLTDAEFEQIMQTLDGEK